MVPRWERSRPAERVLDDPHMALKSETANMVFVGLHEPLPEHRWTDHNVVIVSNYW